jgi:hypothetical protein
VRPSWKNIQDISRCKRFEPGMVAPVCNPSTQDAEEGGSPIQGQPGLHNKTLPQLKSKTTTRSENTKSMTEKLKITKELIIFPKQ